VSIRPTRYHQHLGRAPVNGLEANINLAVFVTIDVDNFVRDVCSIGLLDDSLGGAAGTTKDRKGQARKPEQRDE